MSRRLTSATSAALRSSPTRRPRGSRLFRWRQPGPPPAGPDALGRVGWHELLAADREEALAFYGALFGWEKADADVGPTGTYQLFSVAGEAIGGMVAKPDTMPAPYWLYYFNVSDIDATAQRIVASGGQILGGAQEVPGGSWIVQCEDPQGAPFALEGNRGRNPVGYFERVGREKGPAMVVVNVSRKPPIARRAPAQTVRPDPRRGMRCRSCSRTDRC